MASPDALHPWDRRPGETANAYAAFLAYRDMGRRRSLSKLAEADGRSRSRMSGWNSQHNWQDRVAAWDQHLDAERNQAAIDSAREMQDDWMKMSRAMLNRAAQGLKKLEDTPLTPKQVVDLADCSLRFAKAAMGVADISVSVGADESEDAVKDRRNRMWKLLTTDPDAQDLAERLVAIGVQVPDGVGVESPG